MTGCKSWIYRPMRCKFGLHRRRVYRDHGDVYFWRCALCYQELEHWPWLEKKFQTEWSELCDDENSENVTELFKREKRI